MNALLIVLLLATGAGVISLLPAEGSAALLWCGALAVVSGGIISRVKDDREFLLRLFVAGLILRVLLATVINVINLHNFFGPDAFTYDAIGADLQESWATFGFDIAFSNIRQSNYGMSFIVAVIYSVVGRNLLAVQFTNAVFGAATAPVIYLCARLIYENKQVARFSALCVAFYPSLVLWSAQGLKDAIVVFFITIIIFAALKLGEKLTVGYIAVLIGGLIGVLAMRFYIFYMAVVAVTGALMIGTRQLAGVSVLRQFAIVVIIAMAFAYLGVRQTATEQIGTFTNLENVQRTRSALATGGAGLNESADVSTASGALTAIPTSMAYLLFAPFPWQLTNLRQSITLPEMIVWWSMFPLLALGLWFTIKYRVRQAFAILLFTSMLTLAYSVFQGNIGAAYRQRSQLLVFYFIFVAVGFVLLKERREEQQRERERAREERQLATAQARLLRMERNRDLRSERN